MGTKQGRPQGQMVILSLCKKSSLGWLGPLTWELVIEAVA